MDKLDHINLNLSLLNRNMSEMAKNMEKMLEILENTKNKPIEKSGPRNKGKRWNLEQDRDLTDFFNQNKSLESAERNKVLAEMMGRTSYSIHLRLIQLNLIEEDDPIKLKYSNYGKSWKEEEKEIVKEMFEKGVDIKEIANKIKRPETSIENLLEKLGLIEIVLEN